MASERWRQGRHSGHNLYRQTGPEPSKSDPQIGVMFDPADAETVVAAVNGAEYVRELARRWVDDEPEVVTESVVAAILADLGQQILAALCPHPSDQVSRRIGGDLLCEACRTVVGNDGGRLVVAMREAPESVTVIEEARDDA